MSHEGLTYGIGGTTSDGSVALVGRLFPHRVGLWSASTGIELINVPQALNGDILSGLNGVSRDGSRVVGNYLVSIEPPKAGVFIWTAGGVTTLQLPEPYDTLDVTSVSASGSFIVGTAFGYNADGRIDTISDYVWELDTGFTPLPRSTASTMFAEAVSEGGTVVGNEFIVLSDPPLTYGVPALWTPGGGVVQLDTLGSAFEGDLEWTSGNALAITPDGDWIVGSGFVNGPGNGGLGGALRWDQTRTPQALGKVQTVVSERSVAEAISDDGTTVAGWYEADFNPGPDDRGYFVWTETDGMRDVAQLIFDGTGVDRRDCRSFAEAVLSGDGRVLYGLWRCESLDPRTRVFRFELTPTACPADTNGDGLVNPGDFNAWVIAFNN
ncbi:MAG: hypothetical protein AAFY46_11180, partial [Planctomycetota bacterium]